MAPKAATLMGLLAFGCASGQARVPANPSPGCFSTAARAANISYPTAANISVGGIVRTYWAYAPLRPRYDEKLPGSEDRAHAEEESMPLVLNFHGWRGNAFDHMNDVGGNLVAEMGTFVIVYPGGMGDNPDQTQSWGSWNAVGSTASPGPFGPTCRGGDLSLCYASCSARAQGCDPHGCDWTTCADDVGFVQALVDELESTMCIDRNRIFATGFSNGAMMAYQVAMSLSDRFAAVAPVEGGIHPGFLKKPAYPISLLDIHGTADTLVPINGTAIGTMGSTNGNATGIPVSTDSWLYTNQSTIMAVFRANNNCSGSPQRYLTMYDGSASLYCIHEGHCWNSAHSESGHRTSLVHCAWDGAHNVPGANDDATNDSGTPEYWGMKLVWSWFAKHARVRPTAM